MLLAALSLTSALFGTAFTFDPARDLGAVGKSYLAPSAPVMWRGSFPDGALRIFRVVGSDGEALRIRSADGWTGRVIGTDAVVVPSKADSAARGVVTEYRFEEGCLVGLVQGGKLSRFKNPEAISLSGRPPQIWKAREDFRPEELVVMFKGTDRLQLFFRNPNCTGALMAELCILAVALLLTSRPIWRLHGLLLLASFLLLMGQTKSRGALLAFGLASAVILVARGRGILRVLSRRNVIGLAAIGFAIAGMLYFGGYRERFAQKAANRQSDAGRTEALSKVPEMIACAPGGWNEPVAGMT